MIISEANKMKKRKQNASPILPPIVHAGSEGMNACMRLMNDIYQSTALWREIGKMSFRSVLCLCWV